MAKLRKSASASSVRTVIIHKKKPSTSTIPEYLQKRYTVSREASALLQSRDSKGKMCKPEPTPVEDWRHPWPEQSELVVPADSAAAENLKNPKVLYVLGITTVLNFEMLPGGQAVVLAK